MREVLGVNIRNCVWLVAAEWDVLECRDRASACGGPCVSISLYPAYLSGSIPLFLESALQPAALPFNSREQYRLSGLLTVVGPDHENKLLQVMSALVLY